MTRLDVLIAVVAIGFLLCWLSLRKIETYLQRCLLAIGSINSAANDTKNYAEQSSETLNNIWERIEDRLPELEEPSDPYPPIPKG